MGHPAGPTTAAVGSYDQEYVAMPVEKSSDLDPFDGLVSGRHPAGAEFSSAGARRGVEGPPMFPVDEMTAADDGSEADDDEVTVMVPAAQFLPSPNTVSEATPSDAKAHHPASAGGLPSFDDARYAGSQGGLPSYDDAQYAGSQGGLPSFDDAQPVGSAGGLPSYDDAQHAGSAGGLPSYDDAQPVGSPSGLPSYDDAQPVGSAGGLPSYGDAQHVGPAQSRAAYSSARDHAPARTVRQAASTVPPSFILSEAVAHRAPPAGANHVRHASAAASRGFGTTLPGLPSVQRIPPQPRPASGAIPPPAPWGSKEAAKSVATSVSGKGWAPPPAPASARPAPPPAITPATASRPSPGPRPTSGASAVSSSHEPRYSAVSGSLPPAMFDPMRSTETLPPMHLRTTQAVPSTMPVVSTRANASADTEVDWRSKGKAKRLWATAAVAAVLFAGAATLATTAKSSFFGAPVEATLKATARQSGVRLRLDGKDVGVLPLAIKNIAPGEHALEFAIDEHYSTEKQQVSVGANEIRELAPISLKVVRGVAAFDIRAEGATLTLVSGDERRVLSDPSRPIEINTLHPTALEISKPGFQTLREPLTFEETAHKTFVVELGPRESAHSDRTPQTQAPELSRSESSPPTGGRAPTSRAEPRARQEHASRPQSAPASRKAEPASKADLPPKAEPVSRAEGAQGSCTVNLNSLPPTNVVLDGRPLGLTPKVGVTTPAGSHTVMFVGAEERKRATFTCTAGSQKTVTVRLSQ